MIRSVQALLLAVSLSFACLAQTPQKQTGTAPAPDDKSGAYYHFAMGRLYALLAGAEGSKEDVNKSIQHYQEALKLDPKSSIIFEELTDLYIQSGRLQDAVAEAEDLLKKDPENLDARRMLGRIYTRMIGGNPQEGKINENFLRQAIDQYVKITEKDPKDVESLVTLGRLYRVANKSPEAEKAFTAALKLEPENEEALTGLASLYLTLGDTKAAIAKLKAVTDKNPSERTLAALANAYEDVQDYKSAAEALKRAVELSSDDDRLLRELGEDLLYSDQLDDAAQVYQQLAAGDPKVPDYQIRLSQIYRFKHDLPKAREALNKAKQIEPNGLGARDEEANLLEAEGKTQDAISILKSLVDDTARRTYSDTEKKQRVRLLERLAIDYRKVEQYQQAIDTFKQIANLDAEVAGQAAVQIAETYRAQQDYPSALREADAAFKKYPKDRAVVAEHASILADDGKVDQAATEMRTLLDGKQDRAIHLELAQIYEKGKRWTDMGKELDAAEKLSTDNDDKETVHFMRGAMQERQKHYDAAETEFRKVIDLNPKNAGALNYLGYMLADRNTRLDEAYDLVKKALEIEPDNGAYLDSLGWVYYRQGKLSEAEDLLQRAIQKQPDPTVHDHLGDVYLKEGKIREAIAQWQASLKEFQGQPQSANDPEEVATVNRKLGEAQARLARQGR